MVSFRCFGMAYVRRKLFKGTHWLDNLKLRLSYGVTGNNNVDDYVTIATASGPSYVVLGGSEIQGYYPNGLVNTGLIWER